MLRFHAWEKWQGDGVYDRIRKRKPGGRPKPVILAFIAVATNIDDPTGNFRRFAKLVGGGIRARGYLVAILGYIGRNDATTGVLRCNRDDIARTVLTDATDSISKGTGQRVYDALIESEIAEEIAPEDVRELDPNDTPSSPPSSGEASGPDGGEASGEAPQNGSSGAGKTPRMPARDVRLGAGAARAHTPARDTRAASNQADLPGHLPRRLPGAEERRGEERTYDPPPPGQGGTSTPSRDGPRNDHDAAPRPLRPRERERFAKVLDYAVLRGTTAEQAMARVDREAHRRQPLDDARIAELLAGRYAWVTRQKLARWLAEGRVGWRERRAAAEQAPRRVTAHPVDQCPRHGRPMPCTVCTTAATTPADPAVAAKAIADARATLSRRPAAAPTGTTAPPPRMSEEERAAVRLAGDLAEIPEGDARHEEARGLLGESVRDRAWAERATVLLDPLEAFGGGRAA